MNFIKRVIKNILKRLTRKESDPVVMESSHISSDSIIGDHTYIGYNCFVTKANIGRYCSIANNVSIGLGEHDITEVSTSSYFYDNAYEKLTEKECTIGHDVWIGVDVIIRRGVKIGNGSVIGANSFVNADVPEYAIVAGTPAKVIKYRFSPEQIATLKQSNWWNLNLEDAKLAVRDLKIKINLIRNNGK